MFNIFKKKEKEIFPKAPHEIFPEIMHWEIGDELSDPSVSDQTRYNFYTYQGINEQGIIFAKFYNGYTEKVSIKQIHKWFNKSLHARNINKEKQSTKEYMQLMKDFQKAYKEINQ